MISDPLDVSVDVVRDALETHVVGNFLQDLNGDELYDRLMGLFEEETGALEAAYERAEVLLDNIVSQFTA
jgi:hypothetical protein